MEREIPEHIYYIHYNELFIPTLMNTCRVLVIHGLAWGETPQPPRLASQGLRIGTVFG